MNSERRNCRRSDFLEEVKNNTGLKIRRALARKRFEGNQKAFQIEEYEKAVD